MAALDRINALAESSPGFVWRLQDMKTEPYCAGWGAAILGDA